MWPSIFKNKGSRKKRKVTKTVYVEGRVEGLIGAFFWHVTHLGIWGSHTARTRPLQKKIILVCPTSPHFFRFSVLGFRFYIFLHTILTFSKMTTLTNYSAPLTNYVLFVVVNIHRGDNTKPILKPNSNQ